MEQELAISLNFKWYSNRPSHVVDFRTKQEYAKDALDTKIMVYEDLVSGWFHQYGKLLQSHNDAGFVVLQLALAQIEGMEQYRQGESSEGRSEQFFCTALKRIFELNESDDIWLKEFYSLVRCGLFHDGMTRRRVVIENTSEMPLAFNGKYIRISPNKFLDAVVAEFEQYVAALKDPRNADLREAFRRKYDGEV